MTTATLNTYYCAFCAVVAKTTKRIFTRTIEIFESIGRARAAAQLSQMGYHEEARAIMLREEK